MNAGDPTDTEDVDRPCIWLHISERELAGLILGHVQPTLVEQARYMSNQAFQKRLKANAAKPVDPPAKRRLKKKASS